MLTRGNNNSLHTISAMADSSSYKNYADLNLLSCTMRSVTSSSLSNRDYIGYYSTTWSDFGVPYSITAYY